jgi:hypothetical protein
VVVYGDGMTMTLFCVALADWHSWSSELMATAELEETFNLACNGTCIKIEMNIIDFEL